MKNKLSALVCALLLATAPALGQEQSDDVLLVRTRAVFIDVLELVS